ncbi:usherin-like, partial [Mercenaria mercenaria]|uniref:usherin-like n=1 Tax=Mercenaria mercenaria TaxID=6596 RepID=UPI00234F1CF5
MAVNSVEGRKKKVALGGAGCSKSVTDSCQDKNAECIVSGGTCTCKIDYYDDNGSAFSGTCRNKVDLGGTSCSTSVTDSCRDRNAECLISGLACTCKTGYYDDNGSASRGTCKRKKELGEAGCSKSMSDSCKDIKSQCTSNGGYCTCLPGYYDSNGNVSGGICESDKALGMSCTGKQNECADSAAECLDGKCTCGGDFYDSNGFNEGGNCASVLELKVLAITFPSDTINTSGFKVVWTPPSANKASHISSYVIEWKLKTQGNSLAGGSKEVLRTATSLMINTGVTSGKTYTVTVTSRNIWTQSGASRTTSLSKEQAAKPNIPRSLTTPDLNAEDGTISIGWSAPAIGVASSYRIRLLDGTNEIIGVERSSLTVSFSSSKIKNGYRYNITITSKSEAYNGTNYVWGNFYEEEIKTVVQVPSGPSSVLCDTIKDESITVTWIGSLFPNGDLVKYIIQVLNLNQQPLFNTSTEQVVESHTVVSLIPETSYRFKVFTENEQYISTNYGQSMFCMTKPK